MKETLGVQAIEAALDTAVLIMESGGSTVAANRAFAHVLAGYGKEGATPVWRLDLVVVTAPEATVVRPIGISGSALMRSSAAEVDRLPKVTIEGEPVTLTRWPLVNRGDCVS